MSLKEALGWLQGNQPTFERPELADAVHWTPSEAFPVHRWFRYREGFSPHLFDYFPGSLHWLDPFCGCGTTLLESSRRGVQACGVDVNPLATFVARTKLHPYSQEERNRFTELSSVALTILDDLKSAERPPFPLLEKLFLPESMDVLLRLRTFIDGIQPGPVHDLLFLDWLSILEKASNAFKEGNGLKYRNKKRRSLHYLTVPDTEWIPKHFGVSVSGFVRSLWNAKSSEIVDDLADPRFRVIAVPKVRTASCLEPGSLDFGEPFDLAIFSPPYANRFDYFEAFKMELWMGGFVRTSEEVQHLRKCSLRNNLAAGIGSTPIWAPLLPFLDAMDDSASSVRMGIRETLAGYFEDMKILLSNLRGSLADDGKVVIVVGNSAYAKSIIPTDLLIACLGTESGYKVKEMSVARQLHVSSQQRSSLKGLTDYMRESVIVMEKV